MTDQPTVHCSHDKIVDIGELIPNPRNPNKHNAGQVTKLALLIKYHGWRHPITVSNRSGFIVAGHARLMAAQNLGLETVPVDYQDYESEAEEWAVLIADNAIQEFSEIDGLKMADLLVELDEFNYNLDLTALDKIQIDDYVLGPTGDPGLTDPDAVPEPPKEAITKTGNLWLLGNHRLLCGDSTKKEDVEKLMDGEKADMVFTDPPYNVSIGTIKHPKFKQREIENDSMTDEEYTKFSQKIAESLKAICDGCIYVCGAQHKDGCILFTELDRLLHTSTTIIWVKDVFTLGRGKYQNKYEPIWFGWGVDGTKFTEARNLTNVWEYARPKSSELHPTMKPVELIQNAINHASLKDDLVCDPFLGSGSTLIACEKLNRKCFGMEIDEIYCDVICKRFSEYSGKDVYVVRDGHKKKIAF